MAISLTLCANELSIYFTPTPLMDRICAARKSMNSKRAIIIPEPHEHKLQKTEWKYNMQTNLSILKRKHEVRENWQ